MDPKQALLDALIALRDENVEEAVTCLRAYQYWRSRGGFEPQMEGDLFKELLSVAIELKRDLGR